jgi:hypothetical protein
MPIPTPNKNESAAFYIDRCMSDNQMMKEYPNVKERYGICSMVYESEAKAIKAEATFDDYPEEATNNAKRAIAFREKNNNVNGCGTLVGWARARQLANKENISLETVKRMAAFKRHQQNKNVKYTEGCGGLMWDAWGGDAGIEWAIRKIDELEKSKK